MSWYVVAWCLFIAFGAGYIAGYRQCDWFYRHGGGR